MIDNNGNVESLLLSEMQRLSELIDKIKDLKEKNTSYGIKISELETLFQQLNQKIFFEREKNLEAREIVENIQNSVKLINNAKTDTDLANKFSTMSLEIENLNSWVKQVSLDQVNMNTNQNSFRITLDGLKEKINKIQKDFESLNTKYEQIYNKELKSMERSVKSYHHDLEDGMRSLQKKVAELTNQIIKTTDRKFWTLTTFLFLLNFLFSIILAAKVFLKIDFFKILF
jgi:chromosome segregation ATPase